MENTDTSHNIRENRQLLLSMRRIIKGIHIQGKLTGSFVKGSDKLVNEKVLKLKNDPTPMAFSKRESVG